LNICYQQPYTGIETI